MWVACEVVFLAHGIDSLAEKSDAEGGMPSLRAAKPEPRAAGLR
jgi:hypothetical protein